MSHRAAGVKKRHVQPGQGSTHLSSAESSVTKVDDCLGEERSSGWEVQVGSLARLKLDTMKGRRKTTRFSRRMAARGEVFINDALAPHTRSFIHYRNS
jgi:hypothetical protein